MTSGRGIGRRPSSSTNEVAGCSRRTRLLRSATAGGAPPRGGTGGGRSPPRGVTAAAAATGLARSTIRRAIVELQGGSNPIGSRVRRPGGGRKRAVALQPGLPAALEGLIEDAIRGDPETPLRWVSRSQRQIARALLDRGFRVSQKLVGRLLRGLGYSCQANRKTREGTNHPDRDAQFAHINTVV